MRRTKIFRIIIIKSFEKSKKMEGDAIIKKKIKKFCFTGVKSYALKKKYEMYSYF